jgi:hypothetical protein
MASRALAMPTTHKSGNSRLELLRNAPKDSWIALSADETQIIAIGTTFMEADSIAKKSGARNYVLTRTPDAWISRALSPVS